MSSIHSFTPEKSMTAIQACFFDKCVAIFNKLKYFVSVMVNVGASSGFVSSCKKPLHEAMVLSLHNIIIMPQYVQ